MFAFDVFDISKHLLFFCNEQYCKTLMASGAVGHLARKYGAVVFFPTFTAISIIADWTHTRTWKRELKEKAKAQELLKHQ